MKFDVLICTFPYGRCEDPDVARYVGDLRCKLSRDDRFDKVMHQSFDDTPITMTRNLAVECAKANKADLLVFVDSDMAPDAFQDRQLAQPFFYSSFDFMLKHPGPCIIAAPYCGPPPDELVYIFEVQTRQSDHPNVDLRLSMIPREKAAERSGIEEVIALPTGLMLMDMRCFEHLKPPYFDYEWADPPFNTRKASTEDVFFTRNAAFAGVKVYCNWYSWAGHWKRKRVGPPAIITPDMVRENYREAIKNNHLVSTQTLLMVKGNFNGKPSIAKVKEEPKVKPIPFFTGQDNVNNSDNQRARAIPAEQGAGG